jgi:coenzyme PQQ synthesis protein D (PqqD)
MSGTIDWTGRISRPEGVMVRQLGEESVLLDLDSESYFGLDETGTRMWTVLTAAGSLEEAFETLRVEYEVDPGKLRTDLARFVEALAEARLIEIKRA